MVWPQASHLTLCTSSLFFHARTQVSQTSMVRRHRVLYRSSLYGHNTLLKRTCAAGTSAAASLQPMHVPSTVVPSLARVRASPIIASRAVRTAPRSVRLFAFVLGAFLRSINSKLVIIVAGIVLLLLLFSHIRTYHRDFRVRNDRVLRRVVLNLRFILHFVVNAHCRKGFKIYRWRACISGIYDAMSSAAPNRAFMCQCPVK